MIVTWRILNNIRHTMISAQLSLLRVLFKNRSTRVRLTSLDSENHQ